jgi:hypothetical protein
MVGIAAAGVLVSGLAPQSAARPKLEGITDDPGRSAAPLEIVQGPKAQAAPVIPPAPRLLWRTLGLVRADGVPGRVAGGPRRRVGTSVGRTSAGCGYAAPDLPPQRLAALPEPQLSPGVPSSPPLAKRGKRHGGPQDRMLTCLKPTARALLEHIQAQFGPMQIISTCRSGARIAGSGRISKHASGDAVDFDAGRRRGEVVRWLIANHKSGGTMTYSDMSHIHVDIGRHFVALNAPSGR